MTLRLTQEAPLPKAVSPPVLKRLGSLRQLLDVSRSVVKQPVYLGLLAMFFASLLDGLGLGLMVPFFKVLLDENAHFRFPQANLNLWLNHQEKSNLLLTFALVLIVTMLFKGVAHYAAQVWTTRYKEAVIVSLRQQLYNVYLHAPVNFFDTNPLARMTSLLQGEIEKVRLLMTHLATALTALMTLMAYLGIVLLVSWQLTLLVGILLLLVAVGLRALLRKIKQSGRASAQVEMALGQHILDTLSGIRLVKAYGAEQLELAHVEKLLAEGAEANQRTITRKALMEPLTEIATLSLTMVILVGAYTVLVTKGLLSVAGSLVFMLVLIKIVPVSKKINISRAHIEECLPALNKVLEALRLPLKYPVPAGILPFPGLKEHLTFEDMGFSYPKKSNVLQHINLTIERGTTVAIIGASGAGKSTLAALIPRFYDVTTGRICIDGQDIRNFEVTSLRRAMAFVSQDTYLFHVSIRENITYGLNDVSHAAIEEAARLAYAHEFIENLAEGYDTIVGDRGVQLSGGQRQRISLARAILRDPSLLILDEATSALDAESEQLIQAALERLRHNRTILVIAHRLATVRNADRILVMAQGQIVEDGTPQNLLTQRGLYWAYHNLQTLPV